MASITAPAPTRAARRAATPRRRPSRATARTTVRPSVSLTQDGREALHRRLDRLRAEVLAPLGAMLGDPEHDRRIDDDYDRAFAEAAQLEQLLAEATSVEPPAETDVVALGSLVEVRFADGSVERMRLVHPAEAFLDDERVSVQAPVAQALLGRRGGEVVEVLAPAGRMTVEVVTVTQPARLAR
jgi:transcription elongation factor GreA